MIARTASIAVTPSCAAKKFASFLTTDLALATGSSSPDKNNNPGVAPYRPRLSPSSTTCSRQTRESVGNSRCKRTNSLAPPSITCTSTISLNSIAHFERRHRRASFPSTSSQTTRILGIAINPRRRKARRFSGEIVKDAPIVRSIKITSFGLRVVTVSDECEVKIICSERSAAIYANRFIRATRLRGDRCESMSYFNNVAPSAQTLATSHQIHCART